jgi:hypothetical protein
MVARMRVKLALIGLAVCGAAGGIAMPAGAGLAPATGCRVFADIPHAPAHHSLRPRLLAWAEVHCAAPTTLTVRVCASRSAPGPEVSYEPAWCQRAIVTVVAGRASFVRTLAHTCRVGMEYRSEATLDGLGQDVGPSVPCLRDP